MRMCMIVILIIAYQKHASPFFKVQIVNVFTFWFLHAHKPTVLTWFQYLAAQIPWKSWFLRSSSKKPFECTKKIIRFWCDNAGFGRLVEVVDMEDLWHLEKKNLKTGKLQSVLFIEFWSWNHLQATELAKSWQVYPATFFSPSSAIAAMKPSWRTPRRQQALHRRSTTDTAFGLYFGSYTMVVGLFIPAVGSR